MCKCAGHTRARHVCHETVGRDRACMPCVIRDLPAGLSDEPDNNVPKARIVFGPGFFPCDD